MIKDDENAPLTDYIQDLLTLAPVLPNLSVKTRQSVCIGVMLSMFGKAFADYAAKHPELMKAAEYPGLYETSPPPDPTRPAEPQSTPAPQKAPPAVKEAAGPPAVKKRTLSPEGRARIAEATRRRHANAKAAKKRPKKKQ